MPTSHDFVFVGTQAVLLAALAFAPGPHYFDLPDFLVYVAWAICGMAVLAGLLALAQLGTSLTPWPSPRAGGALVMTGLYAYARHPIYVTLIAFAFGLGIATESAWRLVVALLLVILFRQKARYEESLLRQHYGPAYESYCERVRGFWIV